MTMMALLNHSSHSHSHSATRRWDNDNDNTAPWVVLSVTVGSVGQPSGLVPANIERPRLPD